VIRLRNEAFTGNSLLRVNDLDPFTDVFPDELILEIFLKLHFSKILNIATLNKKVSVLVNDPELLKYVIYRDMTFNPADWTTHFGDNNSAAFDEELAWKALPNNIGEIYKNQFLRFPKKKLGETHVIVWKPANLSINNYKCLLIEKLQLKYCYVNAPKIEVELTEKAEWLVMTRLILPGSLDYSKHKKLVKKQKLKNFESCNIPKVIEAMICAVSIFLKFEIKTLHSQNLTRCLESNNDQPICVRMWGDAFECCPLFIRSIGVNPVWKF